MAEESLSAEEIVRRVLDAERSIESIQMEEDRVDQKGGERTETHSLRIRVGKDTYERVGSEEPWDEELAYKGVEYYRDEHGPWKTLDESDSFYLFGNVTGEGDTESISRVKGTMVTEAVPAAGSGDWNQTLLSKLYAIDFNQFRDAEVLAERAIDGRRVIGLSVSYTMPLGPYIEDMVSKLFPPGVEINDQNGVLDKLQEEMATLPDKLSAKQVVWVGEDYRVYRVDMEGASYRDDVEITTYTIAQTYTRFNEAELPGPLP